MSDSTEQVHSEEQAKAAQTCICGGKGPALTHMLGMMMPSGAAGEHFRNARIEFLKGFRELIDQRIQTLSQEKPKGTKVNVE